MTFTDYLTIAATAVGFLAIPVLGLYMGAVLLAAGG